MVEDFKCKCAYCGKVREEVVFVIGASREADWVMWEGTGKMSCPVCWERGRQDSIEAVNNHVKAHNARVDRILGKL